MRLYVCCFFLALVTAVLISISAGAQTDTECAAVHDGDGTRVGRLQPGDSGRVNVLLTHEGRVAQVGFGRNAIRRTEAVFFTDFNCTGDAFMRTRSDVVTLAQVVGNDVWYPDHGAAEVSGQPLESTRDMNGLCSNGAGQVNEVVPAYTFTIPTFTPPFHLEPEPCFTPPDPDPEQIINGCIQTNGTLKIVADPADCSSRETPISWLGQ